MFLQLIPTFLQFSSFSIKMDTKLDTVDEADKVVVDPPRKSKKADRKKSEKASMPPLNGSITDRARRFSKLSTLMTSPKERRPLGQTLPVPSRTRGKNPRPIPLVQDYPDARHEEYEEWGYNAYDQSEQFSQDYDPPQRFDSYYGGRLYDNASVPFNNQSSGPYTSDPGTMASS
jgi:hypothetical protein